MLSRAAACLACCLWAGVAVSLEHVHFLIPGGAGGGWDLTARSAGRALQDAGIVSRVSFENRSGAGGGKGVAYLQETREQNQHVLMVSSTPIIVRSLRPEFQQNWRDLTPIAAVIGDYGAIVVRADSPFLTFRDLAAALEQAPRSVKFAGGSNRGDLDHLILAQVFAALALDPADARYVPYGAGGQATLALLSGEVDAMSATIGDAMNGVRDGRLRVLAVAAEQRLAELPQAPTFHEQGYDVAFVNWRGFFAVPDLPTARRAEFVGLLEQLRSSAQWRDAQTRFGWIEVFRTGAEFEAFLEDQEAELSVLLRGLGLIER